jgi:integration host factor subunit alpha
MAFSKNDLINSIYSNLDLSKKNSTQVVEPVLEIIKSTLENGEDVLISGFGKFFVTEKRGRNPQTGKDLMLGPRRGVNFRCPGALRDKINGKR